MDILNITKFKAKLQQVGGNNYLSRMPLYECIHRTLQEMITSGELPDGCRLPADKEFAATLGINHVTLGRALNELRKSGLITRHRAKGTYVNAPDATIIGSPGTKDKLVAVIFDSVSHDTFQSALFVTLHDRLCKAGMEMLFLSSSGNQDAQFDQVRSILLHPNCRGCLVWSIMKSEQVRELMRIKPVDFPLVLMDREYLEVGHDGAAYDGFIGGLDIGRTYLARGFRRFIFFSFHERLFFSSINTRLEGLRQALRAAAVPMENLIVYDYDDPGKIDLGDLRRLAEGAVTVTAYSTEALFLRDKLPELQPLVSFTMPHPGLVMPGIAELRFSPTKLGEDAMDILLARLNGDRADWRNMKTRGEFIEAQTAAVPNVIPPVKCKVSL